MMRFTSISLLTVSLLSLLIGCSPRETIRSGAIAPEASTPRTISASISKTFELDPGRYCYLLNNGMRATYLRLTLDNHQISGDVRSSVQTEAANGSTTYAQVFSGSLIEDTSVVDVTTWIDKDVKDTRDTWILTSNTLQTKDNVLNLTDCELVDPAFQDHNGLEAKDLLTGANNARTERIEFDPGKRYVIASNRVVRGDRDIYLFNANGGQQMSISLQATENNAAFDIISPSGYILAFSANNETVFLPHTGDYQVVVGGISSDASYNLTLSLQ
ncbi:hypothetical protein Lepto7375DRAFT_6193 [Leptolyngbya sp. PCC 7375]|nr:hypothetical protein Lepto7375DRAFT_6193 [Leptolyngbya sp. PCC 7375]